MVEKVIQHIDETLIHKQYVLESARILSKYLIASGQLDKAIELVRRCSIHDDSKFSPEEIAAFIKIENRESLRNARVPLDDVAKESLKLHWQNNSHHPEHYSDHSMMTEMDLMEMACDCNARSMQYGTDLLDFIEVRQNERFHFPEEMYTKFKEYCTILVDGVNLSQDISKVLVMKKGE